MFKLFNYTLLFQLTNMQIKTKFTHAEQVISDREYLTIGVGATVSPALYMIHFYGDGAKVTIELSNHSELYENLGVFAHANNNEFVFNITGKPIDNAYQNQIASLKTEKVEILGKMSGLSKISEDRLNIILEQQTTVNELYALKSEWWYKLITKLFYKK